MRSKEVQDAIELLEKIKISESLNVYIGVKDVKKVNALIKYIEELEKLPNKIRDKIKELEEEKDKVDDINRTFRIYTPYDSYDLQINVFKEIIGE